MSTKLSAEQLEYWHNSVEGDQDVDDEYETTVGEITALLDHIAAQESELREAQQRMVDLALELAEQKVRHIIDAEKKSENLGDVMNIRFTSGR